MKWLLKCASSHKPLLGLSSRVPGVFRQAGQPGPGLHRACWRAAPPNPFELPASGQAVTFGERKKLLRYGVAIQETLHCNEQEVKPNGKQYFRSPYRVRMCMITKRSMIKTDMSQTGSTVFPLKETKWICDSRNHSILNVYDPHADCCSNPLCSASPHRYSP